MKTFEMPELIPIHDRNGFVKFEDADNLNKWFVYTTDFPEKGAKHLIWFDYGIYATIEHFNTDESNKPPKDRCLNKRFYNKWLVDVVARQKEGPSKQKVEWKDHICDTLEDAIKTAFKYINLHIEQAREAQIEHMNIFKDLKSLI